MPRRRAERRGLRLWHVWIVLPLAFVTAITIAAGVFYAGWDLLGARELKPEHRIDSKTLFDLVKLSFGVVAGAGDLIALVVAYRRQRVDEDGALRDATRLHTERFTTAVSQLGETPPRSASAAYTPWPASPTTHPPENSAKPASTSCAPTRNFPTPQIRATPQSTRRNTTATWPFARSGTRSAL
jgi:hypothetical protein